jgi:hypothetical protein
MTAFVPHPVELSLHNFSVESLDQLADDGSIVGVKPPL